MICFAARSCAASSAAETSGFSAAASDQVFGPLIVTSTNRSPFASFRSRPFGLSGLDDHPGDPALVGLAVHVRLLLDADLRSPLPPLASATKRIAIPSPSAR